MQKKYVIPLVAAVPLVAVAVTVPSYAAATPAVSFTKIQFNSPGSDTRSTTSLNAEWVRMTNNTRSAIQLKGWTVRDKAGHVYTFKTSYSLGAGKRVYVHTGKGTDGRPDAQHRYQNSGNYIWNNTGDTAYLRNAAGKTIDTCSWTSGTAPTYC